MARGVLDRGARMRSRGSTGSTLLAALLLAGACASPAIGPPPHPREEALIVTPAAERRADELLEMAGTVEPDLTELLVAAAERLDVHLVGLEHRVKERASLARKIQTGMLATGRPAAEIEIHDVVRYTVLLDDDPAGDYDRTAADILRRAEGRGHRPVEVKNYWPPGDTYSGVNCVLESPQGLAWELQFHTLGSLAARDEGHALYEELRLPTTPIRRRRAAYDRLAARWSWVGIPQGVLVEQSLHEREEILFHPRP